MPSTEVLGLVDPQQQAVYIAFLLSTIYFMFKIIRGIALWIFKDKIEAHKKDKDDHKSAIAFLHGKVDAIEKAQGNFVTRSELSSHMDKVETKIATAFDKVEKRFDDFQSFIIDKLFKNK